MSGEGSWISFLLVRFSKKNFRFDFVSICLKFSYLKLMVGVFLFVSVRFSRCEAFHVLKKDMQRFSDGPLAWRTFTICLEIFDVMKVMYQICNREVAEALLDSSQLQAARELCSSNGK